MREKILNLIKERGIGEWELDEFLSPKPQKSYDPFLMLNMDRAVEKIERALAEDKRICIYGDYDADGVTATSLMMEFFLSITENVFYYIPSRFDEGYGLNLEAMDKIKEMGGELIITVDCGSNSVEEVERARQLGMEIVVTDHHAVNENHVDFLVNPSQKECTYPFKALAGVGVAFKLMSALRIRLDLPKAWLTRGLDLVAIGTIGDIVPLVDENRTFVKYGLKIINSKNRKSIGAMISSLPNLHYPITSTDIAFNIVPVINASGRLYKASKAVSVLLETDDLALKKGVEELSLLNSQRKEIQEGLYRQALANLSDAETEKPVIFSYVKDGHEGVIGIVASKLKEDFERPILVMTDCECDCLKASGRSISGVDIHKILAKNGKLFERFGGHKMACGFTIKKANLDALKEGTWKEAENFLEIIENPSPLSCDFWLEEDELDIGFVRELQVLEPYGKDNPEPICSIVGQVKWVKNIGSEGQYRRYDITSFGQDVSCIQFKLKAGEDELLKRGERIQVLGTLGINSWSGRESLQIMAKEVRRPDR